MTQAVSSIAPQTMPGIHVSRRLREVVTLLLVGLSVYLAVSLATFSLTDPGWLYIGPRESISNQGGAVGAWFADVLLGAFGHMAFLFPVMVAWHGLLMLRDVDHPHNHPGDILLRWTGFAMMLVAGTALNAMLVAEPLLLVPAGSGSGGIVGGLIRGPLVAMANIGGGTALMGALFFAGFSLFTNFSPLMIFDWVGEFTFAIFRAIGWFFSLFRLRPRAKASPQPSTAAEAAPDAAAVAEQREPTMNAQSANAAVMGEAAAQVSRAALRRERAERRKAGRKEPVIGSVPEEFGEAPAAEIIAAPAERLDARFEAGLVAEIAPEAPAPVERKGVPPTHRFVPEPDEEGALPPIGLLDPARPSGHAFSEEALESLSRQVELKLLDFRIEAKVVGVQPGPVVTMFELQLAPGTKASKVTNLAKDLARALSTVSVRVVEVIPGKSVIGLEIPNEQRETVYLCEVLGSAAYHHSHSPLTLALGKDIAGTPTISDLARMPHALIAGTTGSGKSVAINAMILSLLYKATPKDVRLIMVDPKMLELSVYEGIPHLLTPVVTDMKEAANALRWCVVEMDRRYKLMAAMGVRNIAGFNKKVKAAAKNGTPLRDPLFQPDPLGIGPQTPPELETLPYIVVIIDELADMMMVVGKKVEELIARLAQKARAAGVHLLLATQRPSVDVITGLIKANIPSRIAFQVSSKVDSRTILDQMGAEALLGNGDMLYLPPGSGIPQRMHGAFVDDDEVHRVVSWLKASGEPEYIDMAMPDEGEEGGVFGSGSDYEESDALYDEAVRFVTESRRASISAVQRKLKIGYNRAARMIEEMERTGVVSPAESNGNREVLAPPPPSF